MSDFKAKDIWIRRESWDEAVEERKGVFWFELKSDDPKVEIEGVESVSKVDG